MISMNKMVSVIVLNFNRREELRTTLRDILAQSYPDMETIVADNASSDGSQEMVRDEFPSVKLLAMSENIGTHARRKAAEAARGEYVMLYDDDSGPSTPTDISRLVAFFGRHPEASAVCTAIYRTRSDYFETWGWEDFAAHPGNDEEGYEGLFIHGSGTAYRRKDLLETEAFDDELFWGDEEFAAALSFIANGFRIFYLPSVVTNHRAAFSNRNRTRFYRLVTRNHLLTLLKYFRGGRLAGYLFRETLYQTLLARGTFWSVWQGAAEAAARSGRARAARKEIPASFEPYLREVNGRRYPAFGAWLDRQFKLRAYRKARGY